jgi:peptide/nickel transport system substrate-binding protein
MSVSDSPAVQSVLRMMAHDAMTRRGFMKRAAALGLTIPALSTLLAACADDDDTVDEPADEPADEPEPDDEDDDDAEDVVDEPDDEEDEEEDEEMDDVADADDRNYDKLIVALAGDLVSADLMWGTPTINRDMMGHVIEYLFTMSEGNEYIPDLAEAFEVSEDGMSFTIPIRQGVPFHNGKELTSEDVVASLGRWQRMAQRGASLLETNTRLEAADDYTIEMEFSEPNGGLLFGIGHYGGLAGIFPSEVVEKYYDEDEEADEQITDPADVIGTGPYVHHEWVPDRSLVFRRFDDYAMRDEPVDGRGGGRHAYAAEIEFIPVPDATTRLNGLIAGEYHVSYDVAPAQYEQVEADPNLVSYIIRPGSKAVAVFNKAQGPFTDVRLRQAALAATNSDEVMAGAVDNAEFYGVFASLAGPEWEFWYTEVGEEYFNQGDVERAQELIAETDYDGEVLRWITTRDFDYMYRSALVAQQQWGEAGLNIELVVSDWPTVITNRSEPDEYEIFSTGIGFAGDPLGTSAYTSNWPGWTPEGRITEAYEQLIREADPDVRKQLWEDLQLAFYEEVPYVQFGERYALRATRSNVQGFTNRPDFFVWNVWLED